MNKTNRHNNDMHASCRLSEEQPVIEKMFTFWREEFFEQPMKSRLSATTTGDISQTQRI
jgi:hypothetical protein